MAAAGVADGAAPAAGATIHGLIKCVELVLRLPPYDTAGPETGAVAAAGGTLGVSRLGIMKLFD